MIRKVPCPDHTKDMVRHACGNKGCSWLVCGAKDCGMTLDEHSPDAAGPKSRRPPKDR